MRDHSDRIFGDCKGKSRWVKVQDLEEGPDKEWLSTGWLEEGNGEMVHSFVVNEERGWTAEQVSGIEWFGWRRAGKCQGDRRGGW